MPVMDACGNDSGKEEKDSPQYTQNLSSGAAGVTLHDNSIMPSSLAA